MAQKFYPAKKIRDLNFEDNLVRISGTLIDKKEESVMIDDKTGVIEVFMAEEDMNKVNEMDFVRIFGRVIPSSSGNVEMMCDIVQKINIDLNLYAKIKEKYGVEI